MTIKEKKRNIQASRQNNSYYNGIAADYDRILDQDASNRIIRQTVAARFASVVKRGTVLDFGGGTGLDMGWMAQNRYQISFCEPSFAMRKIAIQRNRNDFPSANILFLDESKTDFRTWDFSFPFENKVNAVLANFAVLNCIADIELAFGKISLAIESGGTFFALVLDGSFKKRLRSNLRGTLQSIFSGNPVQMTVDHNGKRQLVYLHSDMEIGRAFRPYFDLVNSEQLQEFQLLQLRRK